MDQPIGDLDDLALALAHWLDAHTSAGDPVAGSRALEEAQRRLAAYMPRHAPAPRPSRGRRWFRFW
jgi:hypothetical protein